jgi:hypothetical protein
MTLLLTNLLHLCYDILEEALRLQMLILLLYEVGTLLTDLLELHEQLKLFASCQFALVVHVVQFFSLGN